jgi:hypothetical protein
MLPGTSEGFGATTVLDRPAPPQEPPAFTPAPAGAWPPPPVRRAVPPEPLRRRVTLTLLALAAIMAGALLLRITSFHPAVVDTDEGLYLLQAREWLRGNWPLVAVWDMHPVGAPALFALALGAFGESIEAVRLLGAICVGLTGWGLYAGVRAGGGPRGVGVAAGLLYAAHTVLLSGLATNTEILFAPFVAAAMAIAIRGAARALGPAPAGPEWRELVAMGVLVGCGLLIKPVVVAQGSLAWVLLTLPAWWRGALGFRRLLAMAAAYAAICAAPSVLMGLAYAVQGELDAFLDGSFLAPFRYSLGRLPWHDAAQRITVALLQLIWPLVLGVGAVALWRRGRTGGGLLTGVGLLWFGASSVAIAGPGYYYGHYFLIWLAPLSLLAAIGARRIAQAAKPGLAPALFAGMVTLVALDPWFGDLAPRIDRGLDAPDPPRRVAEAIASVLQPGEPIFIANYHPTVYFLARAGLPTRFVFPAHLTGVFNKVSEIDTDAELARILETRPRFIVVDRGWWGNMRPTAAEMITQVLQADYAVFAKISEQRGPVEIWQLRQ